MAEFVAGRGTQALGIIGTVLGGLAVAAEGALGSGIGGRSGGAGGNCPGSDTVSRETFDLSLQLAKAQQDNSILTAELNTEKKMVEVYNSLNDKINRVVADQTAINSAQAVTNCAVTSQLAVAQSNIATLMGLTKTVIPNANVCPGWGDATVSISTGTTATT